jgi:Transposase DDE domain
LGLIQDDRYFSVLGLSRRTERQSRGKLYKALQMNIGWHLLFYAFAKWFVGNGEGWFLILDASPLEQPHARFRIARHGHISLEDMKRVPHNQVMCLILSNGVIDIVLDYRIWVSPKIARKRDYKKQTELALELLKRCQFFKLPVKTIAFDNYFAAKRIITWLNDNGWRWTTRLKGNRIIYMEGQENRIDALELEPGDFIQAELRGIPGAISILCMQYQDEQVYVATNDTSLDKDGLKKAYRLRWRIEEFHREAKQQLGLEYLWMRNYRALHNHVGFVCLAFSLLSVIRRNSKETIGIVKRRIQDELYSTHNGIDRFTDFSAA